MAYSPCRGKEGHMRIYISRIVQDGRGQESRTNKMLEFDASTPARKSAIIEAVEASVLAIAELTGEELKITLG
jgi:hypothetical protein